MIVITKTGLLLMIVLLTTGCAATLYQAVQRGEYTQMEKLLDDGAEVDGLEPESDTLQTPLYFAAEHGDLKAAQLLIDRGADVKATNYRGWTPLHIAVLKNNKEMVVLLLDHGADVNAQDGRGRTPLHIANFNNRADMVTLLLEKGADVSLKDRRGWTGKTKLDTKNFGARRGKWILPTAFRSKNVPGYNRSDSARRRAAAPSDATSTVAVSRPAPNPAAAPAQKAAAASGQSGVIPTFTTWGAAVLLAGMSFVLRKKRWIKQ